jgi:hypothetical protein
MSAVKYAMKDFKKKFIITNKNAKKKKVTLWTQQLTMTAQRHSNRLLEKKAWTSFGCWPLILRLRLVSLYIPSKNQKFFVLPPIQIN